MISVTIVEYKPKYRKAFKELNVQWIQKYFTMETTDYQSLDHPKQNILDKGGFILVALLDEEPVGVCAMKKMEDGKHDFELAKMAVSPKTQGYGIGYQLGMAVIAKAKALGATSVYLESNTILVPAISLYRKLGFIEVFGYDTPYARCNIQMELNL